ncbi:hypothetical protein C7R88_08065 [Plesiomonas shigelloides]|nr:hypothetical protein C7R88_08065 [Plesiomonas shigelloides]
MPVGGISALLSALLITDRLTPCGNQRRILRLPSFLPAQTRSSSVFCLLSSVFCLLSSVFCLLSSVWAKCTCTTPTKSKHKNAHKRHINSI